MSGLLDRRQALRAMVLVPLVPVLASAQGSAQDSASAAGTMEGEGYKPVRLPAKVTARATPMTPLERDALERKLSCPCPCTLDVFTCRTSMPCGFSPRMHQDVIALADGGYSANEILDAFVRVYGEEVRMAPTKKGFNLVGWFAPSVAILVGGVALTVWLRRARIRSYEAAPPTTDPLADASAAERERLDAALRDDS